MFGSVGFFVVAPAAIHSSTLISDIVRFRNLALEPNKEDEDAITQDDSPLVGLCSCESKEFCVINSVHYRKVRIAIYLETYY